MRLSPLSAAIYRLSLCLIALCGTMAAHAATLNVGPGQPYPTIQSAINAASNGDTIVVASGNYIENIDFKGKAITVTSSAGAAATFIDGVTSIGPVVTFKSGEGRSSILNGFTVRNGGGVVNYFDTGGIYINSSSPTITNNTITHNFCQGIYSYASSPLIQNNEIDNTLDDRAHGCSFAGASAIWLEGSLQSTGSASPLPPVVIGNILQNNTQSGVEDAGGNGGAGVSSWTNNPVIEYNTIRNNLTHGQGGGIHLENTGGLVLNNLVYANESGGGGGGLDTNGYYGPVNTFIANNTFADNTYGSGGGSTIDEAVAQIYFGPFASSGNTIAFVNNIVAGSSTQPAVACGSPTYGSTGAAAIIFDHNLFYNATGPTFYLCPDPTGTYGNLTAPPQFKNEAAGDFHLLAGSPAIDAGNNSINALLTSNNIQQPTFLTTDLDGQPRLQDVTGKGYPVIDIGAYESAGTQDANSTTVLLTPSTYYSDAGVPFTLNAQTFSANGVPTGSLTFSEDGSSLGTVLIDPTGKGALSAALTPGLHHFVASYPGQGVFTAAISVQVIVVVNKYGTTLTLTSSNNPSQLNTPVTFTATITSADTTVLSPIILTDTTTNTVLATLTPNTAGVANFTTSTLALGSHYITANYAGDATHNSASASVLQNVVSGYATTTTLSCTPNPIAINATTLCTVHVASSNGTPTGSVTLTDGNITFATLPLTAGGATYTYTGNSAGIHNLTASYPVAGTFNASSASFALTVNGLPTTTTASVSPNPSTYGQPTIFTVHVAPVSPTAAVPTGTVVITFCRGATITLTLDATGSASVTTPLSNGIPEPVGSCPFTVTYQGDSTFNASTSVSVGYVVNPAPSTTTIVASPNPAYALTPVTITVTVVGNPSPTLSATGQIIPAVPTVPTGTVSLLDGTTFLAKATLVNGQAVFTVTTLAVGQHTLTANFAPDFNLNASSANTTETILANATTSTLSASPNPGVQSQQIALTAAVANTTSTVLPLGSVQFYNGSTLLGTVQVSATGTATLTTSFSAGQQSIAAVYVPSSTAFLPSTSTLLPLPIASQDFTFTTTTPSITIQTQHHSSLQLTLTSIGGFAGPVALGCGSALPLYLTCELPPNAINLAANATVPVTLTLDTDEVLNFLAANPPPTRPNTANRIAFALLLPFAALPFAARRRKLRQLLSLYCLAALCSAVTACTGYYPPSTPPGTYTIPLTATGTSSAFSTTPITHTLNITLTVTP